MSVMVRFSAVISAVCVSVSAAQAADCTWTGLGGDTRWANAQNWSGNTAPSGNADTAIFPAGTPTAVLVDQSASVKTIYFRNPGMTLSVAAGANLSLDNLGALTMVAEEDAVIDGEGSLTFSVNTGENFADNQAYTGKTLTILAKITGANGFEHNGSGGTIVLANAANDQVGNTLITASGVLSVPSVANSGVACPLGKGSAVKFTTASTTFRYTGTDDATDRTFNQNAGASQDVTVEHAGSGTLTFTGSFLGNNNAHSFIFNVVLPSAAIASGGVIANGGTGALWIYKQGAGKQVLSAANTYTGNTVVDQGVLSLTPSGSISTSSLLRLRGGTLLLNDGTPAATYTATFGTLQVEGSASTVSVAPGATSAGVTFASLSYVSGTVDFTADGLGTTTKIFITGQPDGLIGPWATVNGGAAFAAYSSSAGVYAVDLPVQTLSALGPSAITNNANSVASITEVGTGGGISLADDPTAIALLSQEVGTAAVVSLGGKKLVASGVEIASGGASLTLGDVSGDGTLTATSNVLYLANANAAGGTELTVNAAVANNGGTALLVSKSGPGDVVLAGPLSHTGGTAIGGGTLTVDTPASTVRDVPVGVISGNGALALTGAGTVAFPNVANTYAGTTTVAQGTARILNSSTFGSAAAPTVVKDGGAIDFWGTGNQSMNLNAEMVFAEGLGPDSQGALRNTGSYSQYSALRLLALTGDLGIYATSRLDMRNTSGASYLDLGGHGLVKKGSGMFGLTGVTATNDQGTASIDIQGGSVTLEVGSTLSGGSGNTMTVRNGAYFDYYDIYSPINWSLNLDAGSRLYTRAGNVTNHNIWAGPVTLGGSATFESGGTYCDTYSGVISGTGPLVKTGAEHGITYLRNTNNSYTAGTTISSAILYAPEPGVLPGYTSGLTVNGTGCLAVRVADAAATQPGWSLSQIQSVIGGSAFQSTGCSIGFYTVYEDLNYTGALPDIGVRKFGPNKLTLSGSGANLGPIRVYGGTLDLSSASRYLDDQNIVVGTSSSVPGTLAALFVTNAAQLTTLDRGSGVANQPQSIVGDTARGVMVVSDQAKVAARVVVGNAAGSAGAVYQTGGTVHNTGGGGNDGRIGGAGYGYYLLAGGTYTNNGWSQVGQAPSGVGILEQTGGNFAFANAYGGNYGISRGGTGVVHAAGGQFYSSATLWVGDPNESSTSGGYAALEVCGDAAVTINGPVDMGNRNNMTAMLNLSGGEVNANRIYRTNRSNTDVLVNWNGGRFRVNGTTDTELFSGAVAGLYPDVTVYANGAIVDIPLGTMNRIVNTPLRRPQGLGVIAIPVATAGAGYLGSPFVSIMGGGGKGASAFAHVDPVSGTLTSIEITSPGTGYTSSPTVTLNGGGATTAATLGSPVLGSSAGGGLTKLGAGILTLNSTNTYTGTTEAREGTLRLGRADAISPLSAIAVTGGNLDLGGYTVTNESITVTGGSVGNGALATGSFEKDGSGTVELSAPVALSTAHADQVLTPGLWEGRVSGSFNTTSPNPMTGIQLTTRAVNGACGEYQYINGAYWPINSTYVYTGYLWNRTGTNVTWTFAENFDDSVLLHIDGNTVLNNASWNTPTKGNITLTPGPHAFEARFGQGGGGAAGNVSGWWNTSARSFAVDFQGRYADDMTCYSLLTDPGDGSLLTVDMPVIRGAGLAESVIYEAWNTAAAGVPVSRQLTTRAGNGTKAANTTYAGGLWNGNNHTWIYTGVIWNRGDSDVTWTWRFTFDDNVRLTIDGTVVKDVALGQGVVYQNHTLTPGPHDIEIRFGDGTSDVGPADGLGGLTYDSQARGSIDPADYMLLQDPGDGSLLTTDVETGLPLSERTVVNVNEGTLRLSAAEIGLWEGRLASAWDTTSANPATAVELTTTAANGWCNSGGSINGKLWPDNSTYVYSGYIWNRTGTNATWTFAENFDDDVKLTIEGATVLNDTTWNSPTIGSITLTPGPHAFEVRFGQGGGGAAGVNSSWWTDNNMSFGVDFRGRGAGVLSNYVIPTDPGDGSLFTRTLTDPLVSGGPLASAGVNVAADAVLDLNGGAHKLALLTGVGTVTNGTLAADTVISPAGDAEVGTLTLRGVSLAAGVTYRLTLSGTQCDCLTSSGTLDLTGVTVVPATDAALTEPNYIIAHADGGFAGNKPAFSGFPSKYKLIRNGNDLMLTTFGGTFILFR